MCNSSLFNVNKIVSILCDSFGLIYDKELFQSFSYPCIIEGERNIKDLTYLEVSKLHHELLRNIPENIRIVMSNSLFDLLQSKSDKINSIKEFFLIKCEKTKNELKNIIEEIYKVTKLI